MYNMYKLFQIIYLHICNSFLYQKLTNDIITYSLEKKDKATKKKKKSHRNYTILTTKPRNRKPEIDF